MTDLQHAIAIAMMEERGGYEIDLVPLARVIRAELNRQNREYHDHLNDTAPAPVYGPEGRCPA